MIQWDNIKKVEISNINALLTRSEEFEYSLCFHLLQTTQRVIDLVDFWWVLGKNNVTSKP